MAEITTSKKVNLSQFSAEIGRLPVRAEGPDEDGELRIEVERMTDRELTAAVDAHTDDPSWVDPEHVPAPDPDDEFRDAVAAAVANEPAGSPLRKLADALLGTSGPGAEPRRGPT